MNETIIVAVSGGPDSMALLHMLHQTHQNIIVAHVNYHQRESSLRDELVVETYAQSLKHRFIKKDFDLDITDNFQKMARDFRYAFFKELYEKYNAKALYLGHHLDDDIETYIMQKESSRITEYPGIKKEIILLGMCVKRPLLNMSKEELVDYCKKYNVPFEIDESNLETDYTRNKVRQKLSQLSKVEKDNLVEELYTAKHEKESYLESLPFLSNPFLIEEYKSFEINIRLDALRIFFEINGVIPYDFSKKYLEELDAQIIKGKSQHPLGDKNLSVSYGEVMLHGDLSFAYTVNDNTPFETKHFKVSEKGKTIEGVTLSQDDYPITIRSYRKGDQIKLRFGTKALNRFFIDRKIPIHKRLLWPIIENSKGTVIFVVGLGCDIHHYSNNPRLFVLKL